ncbi:MAG: hypothetical protein KF902_13540 [Phycisphaeraceae bacterium]|nr:hypothetical protein [Phycisphaeraceae bacterium]
MKRCESGLKLFVAMGLVGAAASMAHGQGTVINISGATLLENFVRAPASTNDYLDVDGDGIAGIFLNGPDQLAPYDPIPPFPASQHWIVQYRVVGSVNGFQELLDYGATFVTSNGDPTSEISIVEATLGYSNGTLYIQNGAGIGDYNPANPGGAPNRSDTTTLLGTWAPFNTPAVGGIRIDIAPLDVPTTWAITYPGGSPVFFRKPAQLGYGLNPTLSRSKAGSTDFNASAFTDASSSGGYSSFLAQLPAGYGLAAAGSDPSSNLSVFDTQLLYAPIAVTVNYGAGLQQIKQTELQHLFVTGRAITGENLMVVTRDVGSGTRNAFQNCVGLDPSWGNGENIGWISTLSINNNLGAAFSPTNKGGNSGVEATVQNHRLGVGYAGAERGVTGSGSGSWLITNRADLLAVQNDLIGGTEYSRPTIVEVVNNDANGYIIGGPAVLATLGDPRNQNEFGGDTGNTNARMRNPEAAAYINNATRSIEAFVSVPGGDPTTFTPGELAATQFLLTGALNNVPGLLDAISLSPNPAFNASLQTFTISNNRLANTAFNAFNTANNGRVPTRTTGFTYSDGVAGGSTYRAQGGTFPTYGSNLTTRNKIAGDFDGNGLRNINDTAEMLKAWRDRNGGPAWVAPVGTGAIAGAPGTDAIIEVLGDYNGDGSFTTQDVRYFADGLAKDAVTGLVSRKAGFTRVDTEWLALTGSNNFFGTTLATGVSYTAGASRGDIAGPSGLQTPNFDPIGHDGVVDAYDIDYVYANFGNWTNLNDAAYMDFSADINGDRVVDQNDIIELVTVILGTSLGDVNLDGLCDAADVAIIVSNLGNPGGWADGDLNGDGIVNVNDLDIANACTCGDADYNGDTLVDIQDFLDFFGDYGPCEFQSTPCPDALYDVDRYNPDGFVDIQDFLGFFDIFGQCS